MNFTLLLADPSNPTRLARAAQLPRALRIV
jgi:hypothetical protein